MDIPAIIHQTARSSDFPPLIQKCVDSLRKGNPDWDHFFYDDEKWKDVITPDSVFPWDSLSKYPTGIQRSDIFRCAALYEHGGCYADVDVLGIRPMDSLISSAIELGLVDEETEIILTIDHPIHSRIFFQREKVYMNNFMLAKPGAVLLKIYLEEMEEAVAAGPCLNSAPVYTTGPVEMTRLIHQHGGTEALKIGVLPYFWINPIPDMSIDFPEKPLYAQMIENGSWRTEIAPYFIHCWWHSYIDVETESNYQRLFDHLPNRSSKIAPPDQTVRP